MSATSTYIPRRLDDQWKLGLWDMDVAVPFMFVFFIAYVALGGFWGIAGGAVLGTFVGRLASKLKADRHPAFALHWAYWHLPRFVVRLDRTPPSHLRRMIG